MTCSYLLDLMKSSTSVCGYSFIRYAINVIALLSETSIYIFQPIQLNHHFQGVGVDLRVDHAVIFGLADTLENLLQEGGRPKRGYHVNASINQGYAFFFHKGVLGK